MIIHGVAFIMTVILLYVVVLSSVSLIFDPSRPAIQKQRIVWICLFMPVIILYPVIFYKMRWNYKHNDLAKAKSYLIAFGGVMLYIAALIGLMVRFLNSGTA